MIDSVATLFFEATLLNQGGLVVAADWEEVDYGNEAVLTDFQIAYERLQRVLAGVGVSEEVLRQLAFDRKTFEGMTRFKKNPAVREALRIRGTILRDQVPREIFAKAIRGMGRANGVYEESSSSTTAPQVLPRTVDEIAAPAAPSPARPVSPQPDRVQPTIKNLIAQIRSTSPEIFRRLKKPVQSIRLPSELEKLALDLYTKNRALSEKALLLLIEGLETQSWSLFYTVVERLIFHQERLFTQKHARALEELLTKSLEIDVRSRVERLKFSLQRRRRDLFSAK